MTIFDTLPGDTRLPGIDPMAVPTEEERMVEALSDHELAWALNNVAGRKSCFIGSRVIYEASERMRLKLINADEAAERRARMLEMHPELKSANDYVSKRIAADGGEAKRVWPEQAEHWGRIVERWNPKESP